MFGPVALAVAAHPDDIEFMMAGTLVLLGRAGYKIHYLNLANGSMGTHTDSRETIIARRRQEARAAAETLSAVFHEPLADDLDLYYDRSLPRRLCALIRTIRPAILLVQSPQDYMEDHTNACRVAITAAFCRGMRNFQSDPPAAPVSDEVTVYHALPWGLHGPLRERIRPEYYVDVSSVIEVKRAALACHRSQKEWLDKSQGLDSYLITMEEMCREVGRMSGCFDLAEGWRRHLHLGLCSEKADPLAEALGDKVFACPEYRKTLEG